MSSIRSCLTIAILLAGFAGALSLPGCQLTAAPQQKTLNNVRTGQVNVSLSPFGLVYAQQDDIAFVALVNSLGVLNISTFTPSLIHQVPLPSKYEGAAGIALTHDGQHVFVAAGPGAVMVNVAKAVAGSPDAVVGTFNGTTGSQNPGVYAIEVTLSPDDGYAFISQEYGAIRGSTPGNVDVFKLSVPTGNESISRTAIGSINLGYEVVGTALSPDGRTLYATSETTTLNDTTPGFLSIIDTETLETKPSSAVLSNVTAGCSPVRTVVSSDGKTIWLTARESNHLLAFDTAKLVSHPDEALLASVQVGTKPVGLAFVRHESRIITADSNRSNYTNATSGLSVVDVDAALSGRAAVLGRVPTGLFPRELAVSPDGSTILVSDFLSKEVQAVDVATLP